MCFPKYRGIALDNDYKQLSSDCHPHGITNAFNVILERTTDLLFQTYVGPILILISVWKCRCRVGSASPHL